MIMCELHVNEAFLVARVHITAGVHRLVSSPLGLQGMLGVIVTWTGVTQQVQVMTVVCAPTSH